MRSFPSELDAFALLSPHSKDGIDDEGGAVCVGWKDDGDAGGAWQ